MIVEQKLSTRTLDHQERRTNKKGRERHEGTVVLVSWCYALLSFIMDSTFFVLELEQ